MERFGSTSHRVFSVRGIFTFVLVVIIATLLSVLISSHDTHAADPTAAWSGDAIIYDGHEYNLASDFKDNTNTIPKDATVYTTPVQTATNGDKKILVLYFSSGVDPPTEKTVKYVEFKYDNSTTSNATNKRDVDLTVKGEEKERSSCSVDGVGWLICPLSVFIAEGMDKIFDDVLAPMIAVQPTVLGDSNNSMYIAWSTMRNIANIAFVIVFLIIIYSQLTGLGISNYGLKKLIPRLIVAAILVNLSFIVAALAIDISNILGYSIQNIFTAIRENLFHLTNDNVSGAAAHHFSWAEVTAIILAGGGTLVATGAYVAASSGLWFLVPLLLGLISVLILVVVVLAARQAIIVILLIISPIAFVANLLPNTEKWFGKWKDLFITMLLFFPAFSLVFGGSQLAGQLIIENAGDNIVTLLFGMAVQIAPLVITPLILKFSGSLLGRIAQITNNPSKGLLDRSKNWANDRAEYTKQKSLAGERRFNTLGAGMVQATDFRKRRLKDRTNAMKQLGDNNYHSSDKYGKIHEFAEGAEMAGETIKNDNARHIERLKTTPGSSLYDRAIRSQASKENLEAATNRTSQYYNGQRVAPNNPLNSSFLNLEASKANLETTENDKGTYLNRQRMMAGTAMNATVVPLEASKMQSESTQNQYATMVEKMKVQPTSGIYNLAQGVQSSKELLEASQNNVQALFDQQRRSVNSTGLKTSMIELEQSKLGAEESKTLTTAFLNNQKSAIGSDLNVGMMMTEQAKLANQIAEAKVAKTVRNFSTNKIEDAAMTPVLTTIMENMSDGAVRLAAEKQALNSAEYEVQRNVADVLTRSIGEGVTVDTLAQSQTREMLDIAEGVGGETARLRAKSQAVKAAKSLDSDALAANVELLKNSAQRAGTNIKRYSNGLLEAVIKGEPMYESQFITPEMTKAALQAQAEEKNIPIFETIRGNSNFDQAVVSEIIALNNGAFKAAGGFGLQDDPTLNIENFDTPDKYDHALRAQRISNLANSNSTGLASLKFGWVNNLAKPKELKANISAVLEDIAAGKVSGADDDTVSAGKQAEANLLAAFNTVRGALQNEDTLNTMRDREQQIRTVEAELARVFGVAPLENKSPRVNLSPDDYKNMPAPVVSDVGPDVTNVVEDGADNVSSGTTAAPTEPTDSNPDDATNSNSDDSQE